MELVVHKNCKDEINTGFMQRMINAMSMSLFKYGPMKEAFPKRVNAIESLKIRLRKYEETGNVEWLVDVANFAMIEYTLPAHPKWHYAPTESKDSPGRIWHGEKDPVQDRNDLS